MKAPEPINLLDPKLTFERLAQLEEEQREALEGQLASKYAQTLEAMLRGTLIDGKCTPRTFILAYRIDRALRTLEDFADGKIKRLPEKLW